LLAPPSASHLDELHRIVGKTSAAWSFVTAAGDWLDALKSADDSTKTLPAAITQATQRLDQSLGMDYRAIVLTTLLDQPPFLSFAYHLLATAPRSPPIHASRRCGWMI